MTKQKLKILVEALILKEGQVEDLLAKEPDLQAAINLGIRNPSQLKWLVRMKKFEPIADMVGLISAFEQNKQRLAVKDLDAYHNPNDLRSALEALGESEGDKRRQLKDNETDIVYDDEQWIVVMPHTMESSIQWGKGTTWCTAATKSANLFYNYVGRKDEDIILFYIIRKGVDSKIDPNAKLSVGFVGGEPIIDGMRGGLTVNSSNIGIEKESLKKILGTKLELIMNAMKSHSKKIKSKHPAKKAMQKIAQAKNPSVLEKYAVGMNLEERNDFLNVLLEYDLSAEMLTYLASDESVNVRQSIAVKPSTPPELVSLLARDEEKVVRVAVTYNPKVSLEVLTQLASDVSANVRQGVAMSERASPELLAQFVNDKSEHVRWVLAMNPNTSVEILAQLANDKSQNVRSTLAQNPNTPPEILSMLADDKHKDVRAAIANNQEYQNYLESQGQLLERWIKLAGLLN